jgi:ParB family chromosome partitioning protein
VRKRWLAGHLFPRRTAPREVAQFVAQQLLTMPDPLRSGLAAARSRPLFAEITGKTADAWEQTCSTVAAGRLPLLMLAPIATTYEQAMTEGEGKSTWRTDRYSPCPRQEAGCYLAFLASIGYQLADIERAVVDGVHYAGNVPSTDSLPGVANNEPGSCGGDPGLGDEPSPAPDITDGVGRHPRDSTTGVVSVGAETAAA